MESSNLASVTFSQWEATGKDNTANGSVVATANKSNDIQGTSALRKAPMTRRTVVDNLGIGVMTPATLTQHIPVNTTQGTSVSAMMPTHVAKTVCIDSIQDTGVLATRSMEDHSSDYVSLVLPHGGFSFVDMGIGKFPVETVQSVPAHSVHLEVNPMQSVQVDVQAATMQSVSMTPVQSMAMQQSVPVETAHSVGVDTVQSVQVIPVQSLPMNSVHNVPLQSVPLNPVQSIPVATLQSVPLPVYSVSMQSGPQQGNPVQSLIVQSVPMESVPTPGSQVQSVPKQGTSDDCLDDFDDEDDDVNLVVKATYWWCKDCNVKQRFGCGESIEDHLHLKHSMNNKANEDKLLKDFRMCETDHYVCLTEPHTQASPQKTPDSGLITSARPIPQDSLTAEDQTLDTVLLLDTSTTLQGHPVPKTLEEKLSLLSSSLEASPKDKSEIFLTSVKSKVMNSSKESVVSHSSVTPQKGSEALPHPKLIPVIPALPADLATSSPSFLQQGQVKVKAVDPKCTQPELNQFQSAQQPSVSSQHHSELEQDRTSVAKTITSKAIARPCKRKIASTSVNKKMQGLNPGPTRTETDTRGRTRRETSRRNGKSLSKVNAERDIVIAKKFATRRARRLSTEGLSSVGARGQQKLATKPGRPPLGKGASGMGKQGSSSAPVKVTTRSMTLSDSRSRSAATNSKADLPDPQLTKTRKPRVRADDKSLTLTNKQRAGNKMKFSEQGKAGGSCVSEPDPKQHSLHDSDSQTKQDSRSSSGRKIRKPVRYLNGSGEKDEELPEDGEGKANDKEKVNLCNQTLEQDRPYIQNVPKEPRIRKRKIMSTEPSAEGEENPKDETESLVPELPNKKAKREKSVCGDCGRKFRFEKKFKKHVKLYKGQQMQQCSECDVKLHNLDLLSVHLYHVHKTNEPTSCLACEKMIGSKRKLLRHILTHASSSGGQTAANLVQDSCPTVVCSVCHETLVEGEGRVERHYHTHHKPCDSTCCKCGRSFRHKRHLYKHLKEHGDCNKVLLQSAGRSLAQAGHSDSSPTVTATVTSHDDSPGIVHSQMQNNAQGLDSQPVHTIIAQSVEQILEFEENSLLDSFPGQITVTFIKQTEETPPLVKQRNSSTSTCQQCGKELKTKKLLYQHLRSHGETNAAVSEPAGFDDNSGAEGGKEAVDQPIDLSKGAPFGLACSVVQVDNQVEELLRSFPAATANDGTVTPRFTCALCERHFESESHAQRHVKRFGQQRTLVQCDQCQQHKFHNFDLFNVHYTYVHQPEGSATCLTCSCQFPSKAQLLTHLGSSPGPHPLSQGFGLKTFLQEVFGKVTCSTCGKSMWNYPMNMASHSKTHKSYPCPVCQQGFPYKYCLLVHLQIHSNSRNLDSTQTHMQPEHSKLLEKIHSIMSEVESEEFVESDDIKFHCMLCEGEVTHRRKNVHKHLDLHARKVLHVAREGRYFCPDCGEDLTIADQSLASHVIAHHSQSVVQFVCMFCSQAFETFDLFKEHEVKKHWLSVALEKSVCELCGKELVSRQELDKHVLLHGETQGLFRCPHCKQTFRFQSKLRDHLAKHDSGHHSYACQFCGKLYMTRISLHRHEQVDHIGIRDFKHKCKHCNAQFINATHLRDHVTNKHGVGTSYTCSECGLGFKHLSTCVRHKRVVHGADTPYVCQECGEKFPLKRLLQHHMVTHTGENPLQCPTCLKAFSVERTMQEHIDFVHRGIIKFQCINCGSKFPRKRNLVRHMSTCRKTPR